MSTPEPPPPTTEPPPPTTEPPPATTSPTTTVVTEVLQETETRDLANTGAEHHPLVGGVLVSVASGGGLVAISRRERLIG